MVQMSIVNTLNELTSTVQYSTVQGHRCSCVAVCMCTSIASAGGRPVTSFAVFAHSLTMNVAGHGWLLPHARQRQWRCWLPPHHQLL